METSAMDAGDAEESAPLRAGGVPRRSLVTGLASGAAALAFALGGARAALAAAPAAAAPAQSDGRPGAVPPGARSTGFFEVPLTADPGATAVLIGLLLPAVQKVRAGARLVLVDSAGNGHVLPLPRNPDGDRHPVPAFFTIRNGGGGATTDRRLLVVDGPGIKGYEIPSPDGVLIALLLPAVQADGSEAGLLAGTAQLLGDGSVRETEAALGDGSVRSILPFVEQTALLGDGSVRTLAGDGSVRPAHAFLGPFLTARGAGGASRIGLLLPAVQNVARPFVLVLLDSAGKPLARDPIAPGAAGAVTAFYEVTNENGLLRVVRMGDGSVLPIAAPTEPDGVLIGLLLPAVQKVREAANARGGSAPVAPLGGSLMTPETTVALAVGVGGYGGIVNGA